MLLVCNNESGTIIGGRSHWKKILTSNLIEGTLNSILKRRAKVVGIFPNRESCIRYACCQLMEIAEDWQIGRRYMKMEENETEDTAGELLEEIKKVKMTEELVAH